MNQEKEIRNMPPLGTDEEVIARGLAEQEDKSSESVAGLPNPLLAEEAEKRKINYDVIPDELRACNQWVVWKYVTRDGKPTKMPIDAKTGRAADSTEKDTWSTFEQARAYYEQHQDIAGIGFVFSKDDPYIGIDLDSCINENGEIAEWAKEFIEVASTYSEISPSGKGVKMFLKGTMPSEKGRKKAYETGAVEMYSQNRFFTITGRHLEGTPTVISHNTDAVVKIYLKVFGSLDTEKPTSKPKEPVTSDDRALIEKATNAENGDKFRKLWNGEIDTYTSQSEADLALCSILAFWTQGDAVRIDTLFRQSGLYRDKWDRDDYREQTISKALAQAQFYDSNYQAEKKDASQVDSDVLPEESTEGSKMEDVLAELKSVSDPTPAKIQERLWDFVTSASHWDAKEFGRFCDYLFTDFGITKTWIKGWVKTITAEKRKRWAQAKATQALSFDGKPTIVVNDRFMREVTEDISSAITQINNSKPFIFVRSGLPTRIDLDERGNVIAKPLSVSAARGIMERVANFVAETEIEGEIIQKPVHPPLDNVNDFLSLGSFPELPPLIGIATAPIVAPDGKIHTQEGYQAETRYFYCAKEELNLGDTTPTPENVEKAKKLILNELLGDFPFADDASRANTIGLMLNPFVRLLIQGSTPLHAIDSSTPGTGKTLLATVASMPFTVSIPAIMTAGKDDDEWRKRITAKLMNAPSHILIDNIKWRLVSGDLAGALTIDEWEDRILGQSATIRLPVRCTWIATGNNLEFSDEIARRTVWIRLDAKVERPWERTGFKHENLRSWAREHRGEIVTALLTLVQKWLADGKPASDFILGGYEQWSNVVGGILKAIGIKGFMENAKQLYDQLDTERQVWVEFFRAWADKYGAWNEDAKEWGAWVEIDSGKLVWEPKDGNKVESVGTKELFLIASHSDDTPDDGLGILDIFLGDGKQQARRVNIGRLLQKRKDRVFGGYRLEILNEKKKNATQYRLVAVGTPQEKFVGESKGESGQLDSPMIESNSGKGSGRINHADGESGESKSTPCSSGLNIPYTTHTSCVCDISSPRMGAELDSPDSPALQEISCDAGSGVVSLKKLDSPEGNAPIGKQRWEKHIEEARERGIAGDRMALLVKDMFPDVLDGGLLTEFQLQQLWEKAQKYRRPEFPKRGG